MTRRCRIFAPTVVLLAALTAALPAAAASWALEFGSAGPSNEVFTHAEPTADGGFIAVGWSDAPGAGGTDGLVFKVDALGAVQWEWYYGGSSDDRLWCVKPTWDGGYIAVGETQSAGAGGWDLWFLKLDESGTVLWEQTYGGAGDDSGRSVVQCPDGNYAAVGFTGSFHSGRTDTDAYAVKVAYADGARLWETVFSGNAEGEPPEPDLDERLNSVDLLADGNLIAAGATGSFGTELDVLLMRLDTATGVVFFPSTPNPFTMDSEASEEAFGVSATPDGGLALAGTRTDGGGSSLFAVKLDSSFAIQYQTQFPGCTASSRAGIVATHQGDGAGGTYYGLTATWDAGSGAKDLWLLKVDSQLRAGGSRPGTWEKAFGANPFSEGFCVRETYDGGLVAAGSVGDLHADGYLLKVGADGSPGSGDYCGTSTDVFSSPSFSIQEIGGSTWGVTSGAAATLSRDAFVYSWLSWCSTCAADAYEPDDACFATPSVLHGGESQAHNFCDDAADWVSFNVCEGRSYTIRTSALGASCDTVLELYGTDCSTLLTSDDDGGGGKASSITWTATGSGTFHLRVRQKDATAGSDREYTLDLTGDTSACPDGTWSLGIGGPASGQYDFGRGATLTADGGSITTGWTNAFADPSWGDLWLVKLDRFGTLQWQKSYGGSEFDEGAYVEQTSDGGYIVCGHTYSFSAGYDDGWVLKLDGSGNVQWERAFGGINYETLVMIHQTQDGGYLAVGYTTPDFVDSDLWVLKLDSAGAIQWQKIYGGTGFDAADFMRVRLTAEGGSVVSSASNSFTPSGDQDGWVLKLDPWGNVQWQQIYATHGGSYAYYDALVGLDQVPDGGYIASGYYVTATIQDGWLLRLTPFGNVVWQYTYEDGAGVYNGVMNTVRTVPGGGFIVAGNFWTMAGSIDGWMIRVDSSGTPVWQNRYDIGANEDTLFTLQVAPDGTFHAAGVTEYFLPTGDDDFWVLRTDASGNVGTPCIGVSPISLPPSSLPGSGVMTVAAVQHSGFSSSATSATVTTTTAVTGGLLPSILGPSENTCPATTVTLSTKTGMTNYIWYLNSSAIPGANTSAYEATSGGSYEVYYEDVRGCGATSPAFVVTLHPCAVKPVPDGRLSGSIMSGTKLSDESLRVTYDVSTCPTDGASYSILYGNLADLGTATPVSGSLCDISAGSYDWTPVPSGDIFWVIVARVGTKESSWGESFDGTSYAQRSTAASGRCGATAIDTASTCP